MDTGKIKIPNKGLCSSSIQIDIFQRLLLLFYRFILFIERLYDSLISFLFMTLEFIKGYSMKSFPSIISEDTLFCDDEELNDCFGANRGGCKYLGKYSLKSIEEIILNNEFGTCLSKVANDWYVELDLSDCFSHYLYIRRKSNKNIDQFIAFMVIHQGNYYGSLQEPETMGELLVESFWMYNMNILSIKWFCLQNPDLGFSKTRPRLPGQKYPGTGMGRAAFQLILALAEKNGRDGISNKPEHFHNAFLYDGFIFLNPDDEGWFRRIIHDLDDDIKEKGLAAVSWAVYLGSLRENGMKVIWGLKEQIIPISSMCKRYFQKSSFQKEKNKSFMNHGPFEIDWEEADQYALSSLLK